LENSNSPYSILEVSPDNKWYAMFEDDGRVGFLYLGKMKKSDETDDIHDDLWVYNKIDPPIEKCKEVFLLWAKDSSKVGLIVDEECWGIYDLKNWRKMHAPRQGNIIVEIPFETWESGLNETNSESIKPFLE